MLKFDLYEGHMIKNNFFEVHQVQAGQFYPTAPPYGSNWGHKIADFEFLPYISFIVAFIASECIKRYWESICGESK